MNTTQRSVTSSLRGRIWIAAIALAVVNCIFGLGVYLALSFLSVDPLVTTAVTFFFLSLTTLVFGWFLSSDLLKPIEEVTLLARSLERSPSASLPRTTGAIETDQLLQTLHRNGQQLRNLISLMDDVAAGKVEAASMPLESSDKLSASFQKLVSKVTDSITAKNDLDEIRNAVTTLAKEVAGVRNGDLEINFRADHPHTREVSDAIRFLTTRLSDVTQQIFATTSECERSAAEARASLQSTLEAIDERSSALARNTATGVDTSSRWEPLLSNLSRAVQNASAAYDRHAEEGASSSAVSESAERLRAGVIETGKLVQKLRNRTAMVSQAARLAQELSKRSNLIALNATIASNGLTTTELLTTEIDALSRRADELQKQIVSAGEALNSEIAGIEKELGTVAELAPDLSKAFSSSVQVNHSLCEHIANIGDIEESIKAASEESRLEIDRLSGVLEKISDVSVAAAMVRETETSVQRFSGLLDGLRDSVADLKLSSSAPIRASAITTSSQNEPKSALKGPESVTGFEAATGFEGKSGFEAATGFETNSGFETSIDADVRVLER